MLTYREENWESALDEMSVFFNDHWDEFNDGDIPLDFDFERYAALSQAGCLKCLTAREEGKLVGYAWVFVSTHLHHRTLLSGMVDIYYLAPSHRSGAAGVKFFREIEGMLRRMGVKKIYMGTRPYKDASPIFKRLKWEKVEYGYSKWIGD